MDEPGRRRRSTENALAWGGVIGPVVFVADWAVLGATRKGYSPVDDAISRLAELGSSARPAMTAGFVVYGIGLIGYGMALRRSLPGPAWLPAVGTGVATLGVAAFPLGTAVTGAIHAAFASLGYLGLAAVPLAVSRQLDARGHRAWSRLSVLAGGLSGAALVASVAVSPAHGLTQRIGLTIGDTWVAVSAVVLLHWGVSRQGAGGGGRSKSRGRSE